MKIRNVGKISSGHIKNICTRNEKQEKKKLNSNKKLDKIEISNQSRNLLSKIKDSEDNTYSEKVERIKQEISENSYNTSSEKIAERLLELIKEQEG